jgi:hypothetical protein
MRSQGIGLILLALLLQSAAAADAVARITRIDGSVSVLKAGSEQWRDAKPSMALGVGDQLYTREESFAEIRYSVGTILRMDEKTKITVEASSEKTVKTRSAVGDIWVNMKKLMSRGKEFQVTTPTAVASIRGTVFRMSSAADSTSVVSVFDGKVSVGLAEELAKKLAPARTAQPPDKPVEVPGPEEIPGPFEVSLDQWREIVAGQEIAVRRDGKFKQDRFDRAAAARDKFVKINLELDKE